MLPNPHPNPVPTNHLTLTLTLTRYLLSWLLDILIPRDFTWDELNAAKDAFPWGRGVRVSPLERSKVLDLTSPNRES